MVYFRQFGNFRYFVKTNCSTLHEPMHTAPEPRQSAPNAPAHTSPATSNDGALGMAWWNGLAPIDRGYWLRCAGSAVPADAWAYYKASGLFEWSL